MNDEQPDRTPADNQHSRIRDLEARLTALVASSDRRELLGAILDAFDNTIVVTDPDEPDNPIIYVNGGFEKLTGYRPEEVIGRNCRFLQGDDRDQPGVKGLREAVEAGEAVDVELRNYRKDGSMFYNHLYLSPVYDDEEKLVLFLGVQNDVTERVRANEEVKQARDTLEQRIRERTSELDDSNRELRLEVAARLRAEREVRASESRLLDVLDHLLTFVAVLDPDGTLQYVNQAALDASEVTLAAVIDLPFAETPWWRFDAAAQSKLRGAIRKAAGGELSRYDTRVWVGEGRSLTVDFMLAPIRNGEGQVTSLVASAADVTEREAAKARALRSEAQRQTALEAARMGTWDFDLASGTVYWDARCRELFSLPERDTVSLGEALAQVHPEDREGVREAVAAAQRPGGDGGYSAEYRVLGSGEARWVRAEGQVRFEGAGTHRKATRFSGVVADVTHQRESEAALRGSEERFRTLFETMNQGVVYQDAEGRILSANPAAERLLGLTLEQLQGRTSVDPRWRTAREDGTPLPGEDHPSMTALRTGEVVSDVVMSVYSPEDDTQRWLLVDAVPQFRPGEEKPYQAYALFDDITQRKEAEAALYRGAFYDALTGLPNRPLLTERLGQVLKRRERHSEQDAAVLYMDFDRFKVVNDSLGHAVGDAMLQAIADRLKICVRPADTVARLGGDEFVILLENVTQAVEVIRVARRIEDAFSYPLLVEGHELHTSASVGIVASTAPYAQADEVLRDADIAMYRAKSQGRGSYQLFSAAMHSQAVATLQLERELREALRRGELRVAYQPIVSASGTLIGFEALARWQHPRRGLLAPSKFLPFAEEVGLAREIDFWVWREACLQVGRWQRGTAHPLTLSLNLSSQQFLHADLVEDLEALLEETGFDPARLILEITEGALINSSEFVKATVTELKELGLKLYLDDFGTGYSSLAYLQRFPVDALKIDRSFVMGMLEDEGSAELVRTILAMAYNLGLAAVAEGVESEAQLSKLKELGCAYIQGFLFAAPLPAEEAERFMADLN